MHEETPQTVARAPEGRCPWRGEGVCLGARDTDLTHPCLMNTHAIGMLREHFRINTDFDVTQRIILASSAIPILTPSPPTKSFDFRGFDSSKFLILKGGNSYVH